MSLMSPALAGEFFTTNTTWKAPQLEVLSRNYKDVSLQRSQKKKKKKSRGVLKGLRGKVERTLCEEAGD